MVDMMIMDMVDMEMDMGMVDMEMDMDMVDTERLAQVAASAPEWARTCNTKFPWSYNPHTPFTNPSTSTS